MRTIAFDKIRGDMPYGQRGAFEELVCQLARRQAADPTSFRRVEGTGGDGGVECIHRDSGGGVVGYQAKYYTRVGEINWTAVNRSANTALSTYPDLVTYVVAIACDFTGRRRIRGGVIGDGAWGEWDSHVEKWQREATKNGRRVEFIPWTAHELRSFLMPSEAAGLRAYWFGETEFSNSWFKTRVELAAAALDERYNPDDHVDVTIQSLFEFIIRHAHAREKLENQFKAIEKLSFPQHRLRSAKQKPPDELIDESFAALQRLMAIESDLMLPPWSPWPIENWIRLTSDAVTNIGELRRWARDTLLELERLEEKTVRRDLNIVLHELDVLYSEIHRLDRLLKRRCLVTEKKRAALITGRAGTGKSHLFARVAELAVSENRPIILLLGQQLRDQTLWPQILERLGLRDISAEEFLGALDAAAESAHVRGLILFDAINEGPGVRLWRNEIASFLAQIEKYPNLACVLSCRSEYVDYLVPHAVLNSLPRFEVRGFETFEEQAHAARVYLDKRGISRPATPWLAPEFVNPLFLRSCCNALKQEGKTEFPRGLTGTKQIFAFFIESVARHLGAGRDGTRELLGPCKTTLLEIAFQMAENQKDHMARDRAEKIAEQVFKPFNTPSGLSWLETLQRNGLLRFDPDPIVNPGDPLHQPSDVVRFSFQRLQDHLMGEALLGGVGDIKAALAPGGPLSFIHDSKRIGWEWRGLLEALSIQSPEKFGIEFVDALPGDPLTWWAAWEVQSAFEESVRWRATTAFTMRTLDLFNRLGSHSERLSLLIDLSASIDHPWNAELIHRNLIHRTMAERDSFWSIEINKVSDADSHALHRLIDWCLHTRGIGAVRKTLWLCALALAWCFTSSNRAVRDRATKALTGLLLTQPDIFPQLLDTFGDVNDLYIWERLYGAAYGACCIDPSHERVSIYAEVTFRRVFSKRAPCRNLLLRDYARGIVELANQTGVLHKEINIARCRPPYASPVPKLKITEASLKKISDTAGDPAIFYSCNGLGDFGRYKIESSVDKFVAVKLSNPVPYTSREQFDHFEEEVVGSDADRIAALERLRKASFGGINRIVLIDFEKQSKKQKNVTKVDVKNWMVEVRAAEQNFIALLAPAERKRYRLEAKPWLKRETKRRKTEPRQIDIAAAKRWVAKEAYGFGWDKKRFKHEVERYDDYSRNRPLVERIGKKYQWLALSDLLCRLSDNYWIGGVFGSPTRKYDSPIDIGFLRDVDPTIVPRINGGANAQATSGIWMLGPEIATPATPEAELTLWPFSSDLGETFPHLISRLDPEGTEWITLYDHRAVTTQYAAETGILHRSRQQEFRFVFCVVVKQADTAQFVNHFKSKRTIDVHTWQPPELTDGPYLRETPWRTTWPQVQWQSDGWRTPKNLPVAFPVCEYLWESHLDVSLPEGAHAFVPSPWLMLDLGLSADPSEMSIYRDVAGKCQFRGSRRGMAGSSAVIGAEIFTTYLNRRALQCLWLFVAERSVWPGGHNDYAAWRRTEGFCWVDNGKPIAITWNEDRVNAP